MVPVVELAKDKRGAITLQAMGYIAIFVLLLFMSFEIWKAFSVKLTLRRATYQAARYVTLNAWAFRGPLGVSQLREQVFALIDTELHHNSFVPAQSHPDVELSIHIAWGERYCEDSTFNLRVELVYTFPIPDLAQPRMDQLTFMEVYANQKLRCDKGPPRTPAPSR
jgi:hypothetical protein